MSVQFPPLQRPPFWRGVLASNLICMASMLIWATAFPAAEFLLPLFPPLPLTAGRMLMAVLFLLPLWLALDGVGALRQVNWARAAVVGGAGYGLGAFMLVAAQQQADPVTVAVISATMPVVGIAMECVLDSRRITWFLVAALVLSVVGGSVAYLAGPGGFGGLDLGPGAALAFASCVVFVAASRATVTGFPQLSNVGRVTVTLLGAAFAVSVAAMTSAALGGPAVNWAGVGWPQVGVLAVYGIASMALSQILWILGVARLGVGIASMHINAAPFYVMLFLFLLGAPWIMGQAVGAVIVAVAVLVALRGERAA